MGLCKMVRKAAGLAAVVGVGAFALNSVWPGSVSTFWKRTSARVEKHISPEFELARIKDQIAQLTPDMQRNISRIAEEMVAVNMLERQSSDMKDRLAKSKNDLKLFAEAAENPNTKLVSTSGHTVTVTPLMVRNKTRECKNVERELCNVEKVLEAKSAGVEAARQQLSEMKAQKEELTVLCAQYEAELKTLQLEQTRSKIKLDDSRLGEIKASFEALRARIDVERKKTELASQFNATGSVTPEKKENTKDAVDEAKEYLGGQGSDSAKK